MGSKLAKTFADMACAALVLGAGQVAQAQERPIRQDEVPAYAQCAVRVLQESMPRGSTFYGVRDEQKHFASFNVRFKSPTYRDEKSGIERESIGRLHWTEKRGSLTSIYWDVDYTSYHFQARNNKLQTEQVRVFNHMPAAGEHGDMGSFEIEKNGVTKVGDIQPAAALALYNKIIERCPVLVG